MAEVFSKPFLSKSWEILQKRGLGGTCRYLMHWFSERYYERRLGICSSGFVSLEEAGCSGVAEYSGPYEPSAYAPLFRALRILDIDPDRDVFLDIGAGKARVLIAAATYPFRKVMGVELSSELIAQANVNLQRAIPKLTCKSVIIEQGDASEYIVPEEVTVLHLYGPFFGQPMDELIRRLEASLRRSPRPLTVIFRFPAWANDSLAGSRYFELVSDFPCYSDEGERLRIYRTTTAKIAL